jgi:GxxExxY protein
MKIDPEKYNELTYKIIGAAMEVHNHLGPGHNEEVYQKALENEFNIQGLAFEPQKSVSIEYKGSQVGLRFLDFVVNEKVIVEIKAVSELTSLHQWQVLYYFAATEYQIALLINFGSEKLEYKRLLPNEKILTYRKKKEKIPNR